LISAENKSNLNIVSPQELIAFLNQDMPDAILVGNESEDLEKPFVRYALEHNYTKFDTLLCDMELYVKSPLPENKKLTK
jgi:hypothetical protein